MDHKANQSPALLVFVHIPKTAGTTMATVLTMNEPVTWVRRGGNVFKGSGGFKRGVSFQNLLRNDEGQLDRCGVLTGHFPLGIRELIPAGREARFITFLRDPADRLLSHYFPIRKRFGGAPAAKKKGLPPLPKDATLEQALELGYVHDNLQTRMLSGEREPFGEVTEEMLDRAKRNLREELAFFGLSERFDESVVLAKLRLGVRSILYPAPRRVNATRPHGEKVPEELARAAEEANRHDIELYRYATELFEAAPERRELEFDVELTALRSAKGDGEIDLDLPAPPAFPGDDRAWRLLLRAKAECLRQERDAARVLASAENAIQDLERIAARGKSVAGRDAGTALRVLRILAPERAEDPPPPRD